MLKQQLGQDASKVCGASFVCTWLLAAVVLTSCSTPGIVVTQFPTPSVLERYCAWYGDAREGVLYFGQAPFWSAMQEHAGRPEADLAVAGPQWIGRFDLENRAPGPPLDVSHAAAHSGVWDVLRHPNGQVYFTTFYEAAGAVDPITGTVRQFNELGRGLNELASGPEDSLVATRYGGHGGNPLASGSLVLFSPDGLLMAEYPLAAPPGYALAPKTAAWDEAGSRYWVTTDLIQREPGTPQPPSDHPAVVLDAAGGELARIDGVELQFVRFAPSGRGFAAFVAGRTLRLAELGPGPPEEILHAGAGRLLDPDFPASFDFVQDLAFGPAGEVVVTRWTGRIHVIGPGGHRRDLQLPRDDPADLYYSAGVSPDGNTVCATRCGDVTVVCGDLP